MKEVTNLKISSLIESVEEMKFCSFDIFDALTSGVLYSLCFDNAFFKRVCIQVVRKSPVNLRSCLGVKPMVHTKTLSDMLSVYSLLINDKELSSGFQKKAADIRKVLLERRIFSKTLKGQAWGLNFPYATRFVDASRDTPNLFNTLNASHALLDFHEQANDEMIISHIDAVKSYLFNDLGFIDDCDYGWIRYYPNQKTPNFNVNATSAAFFARSNNILNKKIFSDQRISSLLKFLIRGQNKNGSWFYTPSKNGKWIDGYHTGYILESLAYIQSEYTDVCNPELAQCIDKGINFYIKNLFLDDGAPKYYHDNFSHIESQNCAQAIQTLSRLMVYLNEDYSDLLGRVIGRSLSALYVDKGYIRHTDKKGSNADMIFLRWSQTPMILALIYARKALCK